MTRAPEELRVPVGLRVRLMGAFALLAVTPTVLLGVLAIRSARRDVQREVTRGNLALIRAIGRELNGTLQDTRRALVVSAAAWAQTPIEAQGQRILRSLRSEFAILRQVTLLDARGRHLGGDRYGQDGRPFPVELANTYGGYVSEVLFDKDRRLVQMAVQARDRKGELRGFVAGTVDLGFVHQRLAEARLGRGAALLVLDGNGRKVAQRGRLPDLPWGPAGRAENLVVDRVLATHTEGHLELEDRRGTRWVSVYRNIVGMSEFRGVRWGVVLLQPTADAYALARKTTRDTLAVTVLMLLIALAAGAWLAGRITRPLARLVRQTEMVAQENFEATFEPHPSRDEIGVLSRSFAAMVQRLRQSRDNLYALTEFRENLVRSIPVGVISVDRHGEVNSFNPAQEQLSALDAERALGRSIWELFQDPECAPPLLKRLRRVLEEGTILDETLDDLPTAFTNEPRLRYRVHMGPLRDRQGQVDGAVILQEDLSERARLEVQLLRSEKLSSVGVLAAGVAHEINNPLTTVLGYAKLLLEGRSEDDPDYMALDLVAGEARRVQEIVRNLLDFSRQETGEVTPTAINEVVERTLNLVAPDLRKRSVEVRRELDPDLPMVMADTRRTEQVLVNLVTNAAHAMDGGGTLTVRTGTEARRKAPVLVELTDTGHGIPAEILPRIFDPFFTTKEPGQGTGLGLAISQRIMTDQGGEIEVRSRTGEPSGTTFRVWFAEAREGGPGA